MRCEGVTAHSPAGERLQTAQWAATRGDDLYGKLAKYALVPPRIKMEQTTLAAFLDAYIASRSDVKGSTAIVYGHTKRCLIE